MFSKPQNDGERSHMERLLKHKRGSNRNHEAAQGRQKKADRQVITKRLTKPLVMSLSLMTPSKNLETASSHAPKISH